MSATLDHKLDSKSDCKMSATAKRKVLLMGKSGSGKTSMRSVIFQNYSARDTRRLGATIDVEQSAVRFLGSLVLNLWDCGGQNAFVDNYLTAQKDTIFANVAVLIYVFDITSTEWENDVRYFEEIISALRENSSDAGVWVLINKMDLVDKEDPKRKKYAERSEDIVKIDERVRSEMSDDGRRGGLRCFPTSIWDESLYKAWSSVIHTLIPNINLITAHLTYLRDICMAVEAVAFEAETFLVISKSGSPLDSNEAELDDQETRYGAGSLSKHRFEKISEIIKGFRKTCQRTGESFTGFEAKFDDCTVVLEPLTQNQFVLVVAADPIVESALIQYNIYHSQSHLAEFARKSVLDRKCGICRRNTELKYEVKDDDDPSVLAWDEAWDRLKQVNGRLNERISRVEIGD